MANIILYGHNGSENHGCEAIVRTFVKVNDSQDVYLLPYNENTDKKYGVDKIVKEIDSYFQYGKLNPWRIYVNVFEKLLKKKDIRFKVFLKNIKHLLKPGNIAVSVGGDNYCYPSFPPTLASYNRIFNSFGLKTVLFGASIEPELLKDPEIQADMKNYSLIMARESITYNALLENGVVENVVLVPDSAFILDKKELPVPDNFAVNNTVGINLSPRVGLSGPNHEKCFAAYTKLIEYILTNTDMDIALIPHVVQKGTDDREVLEKFYEKYKNSNRICLIPDGSCEELKGYISRCRFIIAARTHCSIAAYSTNVPTLVVGYSVKSRGIAQDLFGTYENYVVPVETISSDEDLIKAFMWLVENELTIKNHLREKMTEYCQRVYDSQRLIMELEKKC